MYRKAPISEKDRLCARQSSKSATASGVRSTPAASGPRFQTITSRSGSLNGNGLSNTALTTLNMAVFSVVNAELLRPLPFNDPERLVMVWNRGPEAAGVDRTPLAVADLLDWRAQSRSFS